MKFNPDKFTIHLFKNIGLIAPLTVCAAALGVHFSADSVTRAVKMLVADSSADVAAHRVRIESAPVDKALIRVAAERLTRLSPSVSVSATDSAISVSISEAERFPEFIYSLSQLQFLNPQATWSADSICLGRCEGNKVALAKVTPTVRRLETDVGK